MSLRGSGLALIIAATVEKMGAEYIGSLGDKLWAITCFSYRGLSVREEGTFCFVGAF